MPQPGEVPICDTTASGGIYCYYASDGSRAPEAEAEWERTHSTPEPSTPPQDGPPKPPVAGKSEGRTKALKSYMDWVQWKRSELGNLIKKYRAEYPKQIEAYKASAYGALPKAQKDMWGSMYTNLDQRGLSDSTSFQAGARSDLENWMSGEKSKIADTAQGMEATAQGAIMAALGKPDYSALYQNWVAADDQQNAYNYRKFQIDPYGLND